MTKLKSKKMSKSTFAVIIMAIVMVAMLAFGGTYAYFSAVTSEGQAGSVTAATIAITNKKETATATITGSHATILPKETFTVTATVSDASDREAYIFAKIEISNGNATLDEDATIEGWTELEAGVYYMTGTGSADDYDFAATLVYDATAQSVDGTDSSNTMGEEITVTVTFSAIQTVGFDGAAEAYAELTK